MHRLPTPEVRFGAAAALFRRGVEVGKGQVWEMSKPPGRYDPRGDAARGMSLGVEFVGTVFVFWLIGRLIDNWLGTEPWGQVVGAVIGWVGGILHVYYKTQNRENRDGSSK
jgi:F0F1-type ATP synthase assembly protein I